MKRMVLADSWIVLHKPNPQARLRLFCFPYGGGGPSLFRTWADGLPQDVAVWAVQFPGRETRIHEAPFTQVSQAVETLAQVLQPYLDDHFAFFGHSLGAFVSFELARLLRRQNAPCPLHLFVSGQRAPQIADQNPHVHHLPDDEFIEEIRCRYNGIPQAVLQSEELMQLLLPTLRADFAMNDAYGYVDESPLDYPISCFGGKEDFMLRREDLEGWRVQTRSSFTLRMFPGDHFFLESAQTALLQAISDDLRQYIYGECSGCSAR